MVAFSFTTPEKFFTSLPPIAEGCVVITLWMTVSAASFLSLPPQAISIPAITSVKTKNPVAFIFLFYLNYL